MPVRYSSISGSRDGDRPDDASPEGTGISPDVMAEFFVQKEAHHQIDKALIIPGATIPFSLFLQKDYRVRMVLEASAESPARIEDWMPLQEGDFMVRRADMSVYADYLTRVLREHPPDTDDAARIKVRAMRESSKIVVRELFDDPRSGEKLQASKVMVHNLIDGIMKDGNIIIDMLSLRDYDYYTYTHSVNVAVLSIGLGMASGLHPGLVEDLGIGAMLHDIGKGALPADIVNKQGNLDPREYELMKTHVAAGEKILGQHNGIPGDSFYALAHHHEKLSGKGYPRRLAGVDIHPFGKISAIADCYDALTTDRPYRRALEPYSALSIIVRETDDFDDGLLALFIRMLGGPR